MSADSGRLLRSAAGLSPRRRVQSGRDGTGAALAELCAIIDAAVRERGAALMGVLNVTPDSFFDGGRYQDVGAARERVDAILGAGADLIDIGGESSRPGAPPVSAAVQIERIGPAVDHAVGRGAVVSVDTTNPDVAAFALEHGARLVNDVSCLGDDALARVAARHGAALVVTHARGSMTAMRGFSDWPDDDYGDVVTDVLVEWRRARARAVAQGMREADVWLDPGLGFSKNARHSLELLGRLDELSREASPLVIGPGRKSFIASVDPAPPADRLGGTIAACLGAVALGAKVLRVHDVREVRQALGVARATENARARSRRRPTVDPGGAHAG